jgi:hypothetical protein
MLIKKHTYHSRFIPKRVSEASQIFLRDTHVLQKLQMKKQKNISISTHE